MKNRGKQRGIFIVEMMVVIAIIAILSQIILPTYQNSVRKTARVAAKGTLFDIVSRQEQYFLNNRSYAASLAALGLTDPMYVDKMTESVPADDGGRVYQISLANTSNTSFDVVATAVMRQAEDSCGNFTLRSDGTKVASGATGSAVCW
jgi:type IV pilus assembly protein PilE